jgi:hypothetical protein
VRSLKQSEASRLNGSKSRGPVTAGGKARSAANSTTHGLYCQTVVLENESEDLYKEWLRGFLAAWQPADDHEYNLVTDIVDARWRLRRYSVLETKALDFEVGRMRPEIDDAFEEIDEGTRTTFGLNSLLGMNRTFEVLQSVLRTQHRIIDRASRQLTERRKLRSPSSTTPQLDLPGEATAPAEQAIAISENEPGPAASQEARQPEAPPSTENLENEPELVNGVKPRAGSSLPPNWENEPEDALSPAAEAAMAQLLENFLKKLSPQDRAGMAKMRR